MRSTLVTILSALFLASTPGAQQSDATYYAGMRWRLIGPNRAGQLADVAGVPGDPAVYYVATPGGGLWKTTDGGTVWTPTSPSVPSASIGVVRVAPSNPDVVYIGTGNTMIGTGVYRSDDAGATWHHAGLDATKYITAMLVDPRDPDVVLAGAGAGGNFGSMVYDNDDPNAARGVYRTSDGGRTWRHTLFLDAESAVVDLVFDPAQPHVVFATLTKGQGGPAGPPLYRSEDEGATWTRLAGQGLPANARAANIAVAPGTSDRRLYGLVGGRRAGGLFRSDDGGTTWRLMTSRLASASGRLYVDPHSPDVVYTMGTSMYRSTDGGRTLASYKGAPGGDDDKALWIDPTNPRRMIMGADQGPTISVDGGRTWTPWYVLHNGEFYYVSTDNQFPYWIYSAQQDSGTVAIRSRSDYGAIRPNDWYPVSGYEEGHIFADPFDSRYVYTHGEGHAVVRFDRQTGQVGPVYTPRREDRFGPRPAMELSPKDPHWLLLGAQYVLATNDWGAAWRRISPDLTIRPSGAPTLAPAAAHSQPGGPTIVALAPSALDVNLLWAGTSNGLIHLTRDFGKTWTNVTPPDLAKASSLTLWSIEASRHDPGVAFATAIDVSDRHGPCIFRTRDFGRSWQTIVDGLPPDVPTRVVREDPERASLLYAGTQAGMYVSFDGGDRWQSLQLNLPTAAVNDITIHENDLVVATYGRALWVLDDVTPLRQLEAVRAGTGTAFLFQPETAMRVRWDNNKDTPLPPEVPSGENPPDGAIIDYYLRSDVTGPATLSILDRSGHDVREYTNTAPPPDETMPNVPMYWFKGPDVLPTTAGMHRFVWDLRYPTPPPLNYGSDGNPATSVSYGIIAPAIEGQSPRQQPIGPLALPGTYHVRLTVGGRAYTRDLVVENDPRVRVTAADLQAHLGWERGLAAGIATSHDAIEQVRALRAALTGRVAGASAQVKTAADAFDNAAVQTIASLARNRDLAEHLASLEYADIRPNTSAVAALGESCRQADASLERYRQLIARDLASLNAALSAAHLDPLPAPAPPAGPACGTRSGSM
ncbi:MAG TPA: hypothetical protein VFX12_05870 [Vicinamibacterales bacterium]|nr:hypothetical protein [Vicinamibacterales bacterium]